MKYKCIRGVVTTIGIVEVDRIIELPANEAADLMSAGKIVPYHEDAPIQNRVIEPEYREMAPRRGRKPKNVA